MDARALLRALRDHGAGFEFEGDRLWLRHPSRVPPRLLVAARERRADLLDALRVEIGTLIVEEFLAERWRGES